MRKVQIKRAWIRRARDYAALTPEHREQVDSYLASLDGVHIADLQLDEFPDAFWHGVLREAQLPASVRSNIALHLFGMKQNDCDVDEIYNVEVASPVDFGTTMQLMGTRGPCCELLFNGRWYPVIVNVRFIEDSEKVTRKIELYTNVKLCDQHFRISHSISADTFLDDDEHPISRTTIDVLESIGYRRLQTSPSAFNLRMVKAERAAAEFGSVVFVTGSVIKPSEHAWWSGYETQALGSDDFPSRAVVESLLETGGDRIGGYYGDEESQSRLPFVRVFSLEIKTYVYADVDDVENYDFDETALSRLHLPDDIHSILSRVFSTPVENIFGDLLRGKHGGAVILACGEPGVGKTLTAEVYAETTKRPLYVLELGELGTSATDVESNLRLVFARVTRWNAVLQFDECEIFLSNRGIDLDRSAIVGIFLRLLDYYRGLLFLTTNRADALDDAVLSRVMLKLDYPPLDAATRTLVWNTLFDFAGLTLADCDFSELGAIELNGRQIRNLTRLACILFEDKVVTRDGMHDVLHFGAGCTLPSTS